MSVHLRDEGSERRGAEPEGGASGNLVGQTREGERKEAGWREEGDRRVRLTMSSVMYMLRTPALWYTNAAELRVKADMPM